MFQMFLSTTVAVTRFFSEFFRRWGHDLTWWPDLWCPGPNIFRKVVEQLSEQLCKKRRRYARSFFSYREKPQGVFNPLVGRGLTSCRCARCQWQQLHSQFCFRIIFNYPDRVILNYPLRPFQSILNHAIITSTVIATACLKDVVVCLNK